jgi:hypothetical protein
MARVLIRWLSSTPTRESILSSRNRSKTDVRVHAKEVTACKPDTPRSDFNYSLGRGFESLTTHSFKWVVRFSAKYWRVLNPLLIVLCKIPCCFGNKLNTVAPHQVKIKALNSHLFSLKDVRFTNGCAI